MAKSNIIVSIHPYLCPIQNAHSDDYTCSPDYDELLSKIRSVNGVTNIWNVNTGLENPPVLGMHHIEVDVSSSESKDAIECDLLKLGVVPIITDS